MSRSESIAQQLGMSHGAAANRLRKMILFNFAKRLAEDKCFKCGQLIETVEELSIEHKLPWEGRSSELFWDLSNIAFSHLRCNRPHVNVPENLGNCTKRFVGPEGTSWCTGCKSFLPVEKFYKDRSHWSGLGSNCKYHHDKNQGHGIVYGRVSKSVSDASGSVPIF